jgi:ribose transport system substrate-binding protein
MTVMVVMASDTSAIAHLRSSSKGVNAARATVEKYMKLPTFVAPGPALKGAQIAKGKTILIMPYSTEIPYNAAFDDAVTTYAHLVGFHVLSYPTTGLSDEWTRGIEYGISKHVAAIDLTAGLDVRAVVPAIKQATSAGIPVLSSTLGDLDFHTPKYVSAGVPLGYRQAGILETDYAIWKTNGAGDFVEIVTPGIPSSLGVSQGVHAALAQNCPKCKLHILNIPIPDWATATTPDLEAALKADPKINFVLPNFDSQTEFVIPALNSLGLTGKVGMDGFNGTPAILSLVKKGTVSMDVSEDVAWAGAATVDSILRVLGKVKPHSGTINEHIPLRVFDSSNVKQLGSTINFGSGFGGAQQGYLKLWGVK